MAAVNTIDSLHSAEIKMGIEFRLWMDQIFEFCFDTIFLSFVIRTLFMSQCC